MQESLTPSPFQPSCCCLHYLLLDLLDGAWCVHLQGALAEASQERPCYTGQGEGGRGSSLLGIMGRVRENTGNKTKIARARREELEGGKEKKLTKEEETREGKSVSPGRKRNGDGRKGRQKRSIK